MPATITKTSQIKSTDADRVLVTSGGRVSEATAADVRSLISVYSTSEVDGLLSGLAALTSEDIDTLAEINAILGDATLVDQSRTITTGTGLTGGGDLSANRIISLDAASIASLEKADSALQPSDIASGTITPYVGDLNFSGGLGGGVTTIGTSGTDINISGSTLNVPTASATARGVITTGSQTIAGNKTLTGTLTTSQSPVFGTSSGFINLYNTNYTVAANGSGVAVGAYGAFSVNCLGSYGVVLPLNRKLAWSSLSNPSDSSSVVAYLSVSGSSIAASVPVIIGTYTVGTLPSAAANAGAIAVVTDSSVSASGNYGATVSGGGANRVKVFSDGTNWVIA